MIENINIVKIATTIYMPQNAITLRIYFVITLVGKRKAIPTRSTPVAISVYDKMPFWLSYNIYSN